MECARLGLSSVGVRQPVLGIKQISGLEYFLLAQGQVHSFNWIYAVDCQGKVVSSLNMVFLQKEEVKHVASSATYIPSPYIHMIVHSKYCLTALVPHH